MTGTRARIAAAALTSLLALAACGGDDDPDPSAEPGSGVVAGPPVVLTEQLGGDVTTIDTGRNAFSHSAPDLSNEDRRTFDVGDSFFTKNWVTAPASTEARDGLGPLHNAQACSSCHLLDGRGSPPSGPDDSATLGLLLRLSVPGAEADGSPLPEPTYGTQLQDRAVLGVVPEGRVSIRWVTESGTYDDGTRYELRHPEISIVDLRDGPPDPDVQVSPRLAPPVFGAGLLEAIPAANIRAAADPDDADGDGISGRANTVVDPESGKDALGRFGWKANVASVPAQVAGAFHGDIGITSPLHPDENCRPTQTDCAGAPNGGSPEIEADTFGRVVFYNRTLAVPTARDTDALDVAAGAALFAQLGCSTCHTPTQRTGPSEIDVLAHQTIHPYTDLLLHDMGPGLADGRPDHEASGDEWRTPPLWGLGLVDDVGGERFLLHDGRARTIDEAILWHGGEAEASTIAFRALTASERAELVAFLESL